MTLREFLSNGLGRILLQLTCAAAAALFLAATGTQTGVLVILLLALALGAEPSCLSKLTMYRVISQWA